MVLNHLRQLCDYNRCIASTAVCLRQPVCKKMEKFSLFVDISQRAFQLWGVLLDAITLLRIPLSLLDHACTFGLDSLHTSSSMSTLRYLVKYDLTLRILFFLIFFYFYYIYIYFNTIQTLLTSYIKITYNIKLPLTLQLF